MIPASGTATPSTRIRLTYKISVGVITGAAGLSTAVNSINEYLGNHATAAYLVARASTPEFGGGVVRKDYFVTVDMITNYSLPTQTWGQLLASVQRIPLGLAGFDARADLSDSTLIARTSVQTQPAAQQAAALTAAQHAQATQPTTTVAKALTGVGVVIAIAAIAVICVKLKK